MRVQRSLAPAHTHAVAGRQGILDLFAASPSRFDDRRMAHDVGHGVCVRVDIRHIDPEFDRVVPRFSVYDRRMIGESRHRFRVGSGIRVINSEFDRALHAISIAARTGSGYGTPPNRPAGLITYLGLGNALPSANTWIGLTIPPTRRDVALSRIFSS